MFSVLISCSCAQHDPRQPIAAALDEDYAMASAAADDTRAMYSSFPSVVQGEDLFTLGESVGMC